MSCNPQHIPYFTLSFYLFAVSNINCVRHLPPGCKESNFKVAIDGARGITKSSQVNTLTVRRGNGGTERERERGEREREREGERGEREREREERTSDRIGIR